MSPCARTPRTSEVLGHARRGGDIMTAPGERNEEKEERLTIQLEIQMQSPCVIKTEADSAAHSSYR